MHLRTGNSMVAVTLPWGITGAFTGVLFHAGCSFFDQKAHPGREKVSSRPQIPAESVGFNRVAFSKKPRLFKHFHPAFSAVTTHCNKDLLSTAAEHSPVNPPES